MKNQKSKIHPVKYREAVILLKAKLFNRVKNQKFSRGVTLIELIIVLTVLTFVIGTTASIFISMMQSQSRAQKEQELFSQVSFAVEALSRLVGSAVEDSNGNCLGLSYAGYNYVLTHFDSVSSSYQGIKFLTKDNVCEEFFVDSDNLLKEKRDGGSAQSILSDKFDLDYARFIIDGDKTLPSAPSGDSIQHRVTFALYVKTNSSQGQQERLVQTTVSQRSLNIP